VINEILAHTDLPTLDSLELYNHSPVPVDVSGCWLTDDPVTNKFQIPANTTLPANGFLAYDETGLGFELSADGETVYLVSPDQQRVIDCLRYGARPTASPTGVTPMAVMRSGTGGVHPNAANAAMLIRDVMIHEIMYHPISTTATMSTWSCTTRSGGGGSQRVALFPRASIMPSPRNCHCAGGYLVVAKNASRLLTQLPGAESRDRRG